MGGGSDLYLCAHFLFLWYKHSYHGQFQATMWRQWIQSLEELLAVALSNQYELVPAHEGPQKEKNDHKGKTLPTVSLRA